MFLLCCVRLDRNEMRYGNLKNCQAWKYYEIFKRTRADAFAPSSIQTRALILRLMFRMHTHKQPIGFSHYPTLVSLLKLEKDRKKPKSFYLLFFVLVFMSLRSGLRMKWKTKDHHNVWCSIFRFMVCKSHKYLIFIHFCLKTYLHLFNQHGLADGSGIGKCIHHCCCSFVIPYRWRLFFKCCEIFRKLSTKNGKIKKKSTPNLCITE